MSVEIFLQGKIFGADEYLLDAGLDFEARTAWTSLLAEVLPRALLAELRLAPMLLGSSGGGQYLLVLPGEVRMQAEEFCRSAESALAFQTHGALRLVHAWTENLGDWSNVRKRLLDELSGKSQSPAGISGRAAFEQGSDSEIAASPFEGLLEAIRLTGDVAWSPEHPIAIAASGKHQWKLGAERGGIPFARHAATDTTSALPVDLPALGSRSAGRQAWAVLTGNVDSFGIRLQRALSITEHIQLSQMYHAFFTGELQMLCSQGEFFQKITLLRAGGEDFIVYGSWDACISLARELQRLFTQFVAANLKDLPGNEGKTLSMGLALEGEHGAQTLGEVWAQAYRNLRLAKSNLKDGMRLFGRILEWKQLADAAGTKEVLRRLITEFECPPEMLHALAELYRDDAAASTALATGRTGADRLERPWRFYRRLNTMLDWSGLGSSRKNEFQKLRSELIADFTGRRASQVRLRPQGFVALEWARLETNSP